MAASYDVVVIGAGVVGASCALHLTRAGAGRVLVLEKGPAAGSGSTGRSTAIVRQTYSNYNVSLMAWEALQLFRSWREFTGLAKPKANFVGCGVLFLFGPQEPSLNSIIELHRRVGVRSTLLAARDLQRRFPDVDFNAPPPEHVAAGDETPWPAQGLFEEEAGFADPVGTAEDMLEAAQNGGNNPGAEVRFNCRVTAVQQSGGRVRGVSLTGPAGEEEIHAPLVINCAGPWVNRINAMAGVTLPHELVPTRIQVVTRAVGGALQGTLPVIVDMVSGFYGRLEAGGGGLVLGSVRDEDEREAVADPDTYNEVADAPFRERTLGLLGHRVPAFNTRGQSGSYAGLYTVNRADSHPIIDRTELDGFFVVCGFSGHGFKLSPMVGTLVAKLALGRWGACESSLPPDYFSRSRTLLTTHWGGVIA